MKQTVKEGDGNGKGIIPTINYHPKPITFTNNKSQRRYMKNYYFYYTNTEWTRGSFWSWSYGAVGTWHLAHVLLGFHESSQTKRSARDFTRLRVRHPLSPDTHPPKTATSACTTPFIGRWPTLLPQVPNPTPIIEKMYISSIINKKEIFEIKQIFTFNLLFDLFM